MLGWISVCTWAATAALGLNLLWRGGIWTEFRSGARLDNSQRVRLVLVVSHVLAAVVGLGAWTFYLFGFASLLGPVALAASLTAAIIGLTMVLRWVPGRGRHADTSYDRFSRNKYFPVHAATGHAMTGAMTVLLVALIVLRVATPHS